MSNQPQQNNGQNSQHGGHGPSRDPKFVQKVADRVYQLLLADLRLENERRGGGKKYE